MRGLASEGREIRYDGIHCNLIIQRFPSCVVVLRISGCDVGEFGEAPMKALNDSATSSDPIDLFIDARDVKGASIDVSGEWARWLSSRKPGLENYDAYWLALHRDHGRVCAPICKPGKHHEDL